MYCCLICPELTSSYMKSSKIYFKHIRVLEKIRNDNIVLPTVMNIKQKTVLTVRIVWWMKIGNRKLKLSWFNPRRSQLIDFILYLFKKLWYFIQFWNLACTMVSNSCKACGRFFYDDFSINYCSFQCEFLASTTKRRFYAKKDLRWWFKKKIYHLFWQRTLQVLWGLSSYNQWILFKEMCQKGRGMELVFIGDFDAC